MKHRLQLLYAVIKSEHLDGLLVSHPPNITYLTGFPSSDSYLIATPKQSFFITDGRFYNQARSLIGREKGIDIELAGKSIFDTIAGIAQRSKIRSLGFEARNLNVAEYNQIKKCLGEIKFVTTQKLIEGLRRIKESGEIAKIKKAVHIAGKALRHAKAIIRAGLTEIELAAELEHFIKYQGARATSFETIVASGVNSSFPHHLTSNRKIKKGDYLLIDIGVDYQGYKSDLTRAFFLGRIPPKISKIIVIVQRAQAQAIKRIRPGVKISQLDMVARQYIAKHGYGGFFTHNLGHGIGLEVHEEPYISRFNKALISTGMVFTIEPAIYLPAKLGIRLEDDVLVTDRGCEVLSDDID